MKTMRSNISLRGSIEILLWIFLFSFPLQTRWIIQQGMLNGGEWEYGTVSIYGTEILLWIILFLFGFWLFRQKISAKIRLGIRMLLMLLIVILVIINFISVSWAQEKFIALLHSFRLSEAAALFTLILVFPLSLKRFFWAIASAGCVQSLLALWQFSSQRVFASKWLGMAPHSAVEMLGESVIEGSWGRLLRAYGTFPHPNILGGFLVLASLLSIHLFLQSKKRQYEITALVFAFVNILGFFLTFSRSAYFAFIIASLLYFVGVYFQEDPSRRKLEFFAIVSISFVVILSLVYREFLAVRLQGEARLEQKSLAQRYELNQEAKYLIAKYPLLGVGSGNFTSAVYREISSNKNPWEYQPVHMVYALVAVELGLVMFAVFWLMMVVVVFYLFSLKNYFGISLFSIIFVIGFFDHYLWSLYPGVILFWIIFALALTASGRTSLRFIPPLSTEFKR